MTGHRSGDHERLCANRNLPMALIVVVFCGMELVLSWRSLGRSSPVEHDKLFFLGPVIGIAVLAMLFAEFKCIRERLVLALAMIRFATGLVSNLAPGLVNPTSKLLKGSYLLLWIIATVISISMLVSSAKLKDHADNPS
jgi:hypothetical protein